MWYKMSYYYGTKGNLNVLKSSVLHRLSSTKSWSFNSSYIYVGVQAETVITILSQHYLSYFETVYSFFVWQV